MAGAFPQAKFGALKSQARLAKIAEAKATDYWAGSTWVLHAELTNGAGADTIAMDISPGEDNEAEILYGGVFNGDTVSRLALVDFLDPDENVIANALGASTPTQGLFSFPGSAASVLSSGARIFLSGEMILRFRLLTVGGADFCRFSVACRVRGDKPTITSTTVTSGGTVVINTDAFF